MVMRPCMGPLGDGGFVAGTLVHTRDGLVPIEEIRAGDQVLSQPDGAGARASGRVGGTCRVEQQEVLVVKWYTVEALAVARLGNTTIPREDFHLAVVTADQAFWIGKPGWRRAADLEHHDELALADGRVALVSGVDRVHRTLVDQVGWVQGRGGRDDEYGRLLDLRGGRIVHGHERVLNEGVDWWEADQPLRTRVHQLALEDRECWYAGTLGACVHSQARQRSTP